ncbi:MAG: MoxR family ATPase [Deltaproteobacteria bacterium]|nr:MoxR family ATPase [Deltaproteobacteria bacterium]
MSEVPTGARASADIEALSVEVKEKSAFADRVSFEVGKVIVGQKGMIERVLIGLLTGGHVLLEGVPGLAKTLMLTTLAKVLRLQDHRVQFTPDLLPGDLTGTSIWDPEKREFLPRKGPVFTNLLLADEINRAPAKVQSALLESMQERKVTIGRQTFDLPRPFFVMATQNPVEQEGTYPLPEAQIDRFLMKVVVGFPTRAEERLIMDRMTEGPLDPKDAVAADVVAPDDLAAASDCVRRLYVDEKVKKYIVDLVFATREPDNVQGPLGAKLASIKPLLRSGASPRATIALNVAARAHAFLNHRAFVIPDDVKAIGPDVLRHRLPLTFEAEAEEVKADDIVRRIFEGVPVP